MPCSQVDVPPEIGVAAASGMAAAKVAVSDHHEVTVKSAMRSISLAKSLL